MKTGRERGRERERERGKERERERERERTRERERERTRERERLRASATFGASVGLLCHPCITTIHLSYRLPIFETSATA